MLRTFLSKWLLNDGAPSPKLSGNRPFIVYASRAVLLRRVIFHPVWQFYFHPDQVWKRS